MQKYVLVDVELEDDDILNYIKSGNCDEYTKSKILKYLSDQGSVVDLIKSNIHTLTDDHLKEIKDEIDYWAKARNI